MRIFSPAMLKTFEKSKELFKEKYIENIPEIQLSSNFETGKRLHALACSYLNGEDIKKLEKSLTSKEVTLWNNLKKTYYFSLEPVKTEYDISVKLGNYRIGGRLDALLKDNNNKYFIVDYKTGQIPKNPSYDYQTMVYLLCVDRLIKNYEEISFVYLGLSDGKEEIVKFNESLKAEYEKRILNLCSQIKI